MREKSLTEGQPTAFSEAYLPIVHNDRTVAVIEAHFDLTEQREQFNEILMRAGMVICLLVAAAFGIPAIAWYRQHTLLRQRTAELQEKNLRLDGAVNNIAQALLMFDSEARLVLCNDRYRQMYGLSPEMVRPGASLHSLLVHRKELGNFSGDPERYCADTLVDIATGKATAKTLELSDGRVIARIDQPLVGGAWVSTHQTSPELHRAQRDAQQVHARLTAVIDAMPVGLIFYDDQDRLVLSKSTTPNAHRPPTCA
jgi:PAS domain-containing protein